MQFQQMLYVIESARCGSINKAAAELFVSQSTVSAAIAALEEELDIEIFTRTNHGVTLSEAGKELVDYITPIIESKRRVEAFYRKKLAPPPSHFSVSTQRYPFSVAAFIRFLSLRAAEQYTCRIKETDLFVAIEDVYNNRADVGIIFLSDSTRHFVGKMLAARKLEFLPIKEVDARIYIRREHPLAGREAIGLEEMMEYPFLSYDSDGQAAVSFTEEVDLLEFKNIRKNLFISDRATAYNLLANTDAFTLGSGIIPPDFVDSRVITKPIAGVTEWMTLGYVRKKGAEEGANLRLYIQCIRDVLDDDLST